uniref:Uncharacterized protein n=1 Tax=Coccidioides posadasii RMSCC 3488 TaxID=454284 RepID=A0A0J6HYF1_COCPO|nr:hypothetical protein CPAG_00359 [Coccidioides posadasii RMSCC 3488]
MRRVGPGLLVSDKIPDLPWQGAHVFLWFEIMFRYGVINDEKIGVEIMSGITQVCIVLNCGIINYWDMYGARRGQQCAVCRDLRRKKPFPTKRDINLPGNQNVGLFTVKTFSLCRFKRTNPPKPNS